MLQIKEYIMQKETWVLIIMNLAIAAVIGLYMKFQGNLATKSTVYIFAGPFILFAFFKLQNSFLRLLCVIFTLIFIENIIIYATPLAPFLKIGPTHVLAILLMASLAYHKNLEHMPSLYLTFFMLFFLSVFLSAVIGCFARPMLLDASIQEFLILYLGFFLFVNIGFHAFSSLSAMQNFIFALVIFGILTAAGHLFSVITGINLESVRGASAVASGREVSEGNWRYGGFFGNVNTMSSFYVMLIPTAFLLIFEDKNIGKKIVAGLSIVLMIISTLLGASRGALLFASLTILISLFFVKIQPKKIFIGLAAFAVIAIAANYILGQFLTEFLERAIREMTKKGMESPREAIWAATIPMIKDHLLGVGIASENYSSQLMKYGNMSWASAHNIYLDFLARTGLPGFISIVTISVTSAATLVVTFLRNKEAEVRLVTACLFLMLLGFLIMGFTEPIFVNQYKMNYIFATILGMSISVVSKHGGSFSRKK